MQHSWNIIVNLLDVCAETREMVCYACTCGLDDFEPPEKSKGKAFFTTWLYAFLMVVKPHQTAPPNFQLMQADPHKLDFRSDLLARFPGAVGLGQLGPMGGVLPPTHDLTRPPNLFPAAGEYLNILLKNKKADLLFDNLQS